MKKLRCIIVDDEPVARKIIREFVGQVSSLLLVGEFETAIKAAVFLEHEHADLVFLDIQMPKLSGVDWLKTSPVKPLVILTTAFQQYALEGYELDIIDYLLKPVSFNRILKAVHKAKEYIVMQNNSPVEQNATWLFVRTDKRIEKIEIEDIIYIESIGNYVRIVTHDKNMIAYLTLKGITNQLTGANFIKIHQSFLINVAKITAIEGNQIKIGGVNLPISRNYRNMVMSMVEERMLKR